MSRNLLNRQKTSLTSTHVEQFQAIDVPGKYLLQIVDIKQTDSRHNLDGSEKTDLPDYSDETRELYTILKDVMSGKRHINRFALDSFVKFKNLTEKERKDLAKYELYEDQRDGYAVYRDPKTKLFVRIPAAEGDDEFEGLQQIFSRWTAAMGLPEGTTPEEFESFKGKVFKGKLVINDYMSKDGEEKSRLKLATSYWLPTDDEMEAVEEALAVGEDFR